MTIEALHSPAALVGEAGAELDAQHFEPRIGDCVAVCVCVPVGSGRVQFARDGQAF